MIKAQRLLQRLDLLLAHDLAPAVLPGMTGLIAGLWCDKGFDWLAEEHSFQTARDRMLAALTGMLAVLVCLMGRQWFHRQIVRKRRGILLAIDELGKEGSSTRPVLRAAAPDYLDVIEVPGPKQLEAGWHWDADDRCGPHWDTAVDRLVFAVWAHQNRTDYAMRPAIVTWAPWPVTLGLGQRLNGIYDRRDHPQRIVPRPSGGRNRVATPEPHLGRPQIITQMQGYSLTERLERCELQWPVDLGTSRGTGEVPTLLLIRATGTNWGPLPCEGETATVQRRALALRDVTGARLNLSGEHVVHEIRWHLPRDPDRLVHIEDRDIVNLAQDIADRIQRAVRVASGDVLLGMLAPQDVVFAVGDLWSQLQRGNPVTGHRVFPIVLDHVQDDLAVVGLDLSLTAPRRVLASPSLGDMDGGGAAAGGVVP